MYPIQWVILQSIQAYFFLKGEYVYLYKHVHMVQQKMYRSSLTEVTCFSLSLASLRN